jgi:selenocysteine-specific elongation factor
VELGGTTLSFVDVPGHERFIKNMLAGVGGIDLVMLVVAADESVMPQTREHFDICRLLDVRAGLVVLTKCDLAESDIQDLAALEVRELVAGSFLEAAPIVRVSSTTGAGLDDLRSALVQLSATARARPFDRPARLPIDRVFTVKGFGTVVTGTLVSGRLAGGAELTVLPSVKGVTVRGLHVHGEKKAEAVAGQRAAANLGGVELSDLSRGDSLCAAGSVEITRRFDAAVDLLAASKALRHGARVRFHHGTTEVLGRVSIAGPVAGDGNLAPVPEDAGARAGPRLTEIPPGTSAYVRVRLEAPAVLTRGDRFIIRSYSPAATIGGGIVLDPQPPRSAIRSAAGRLRFEALDWNAQPSTVVEALIREQREAGVPKPALISRLGLSAGQADAVASELCAGGEVVGVEDVLVSGGAIEQLSNGLSEALRRHHAEHPLADGLPREEARERLFRRAAPGVFEHVLARLAAAGRIVSKDRLALVGHRIVLSEDEASARETIERLFKASRFAPPELSEVVPEARLRSEVAERMANLLVRQSRLVRLEGILFHAEVLGELKNDVRAMKAAGVERIDIGTFKERYGLSRKYAIPLLEYLDRERVTRRAGASRVIL